MIDHDGLLRGALLRIRCRAMDGAVASEATDDPAAALREIDKAMRQIDEIARDALRSTAP